MLFPICQVKCRKYCSCMIENPSLISRLRGVCVALEVPFSEEDSGKTLAEAIKKTSEETWEAASHTWGIVLEADGTPVYRSTIQ